MERSSSLRHRLSDMALVRELLDNRSGETCSRPPLYAANAVTGGNSQLAQGPIAPQAVNRHLPLALAETSQLLYEIVCSQNSFSWNPSS
jgi:type II secretory pathway predicted ATPase ExeA